MYCVYILIAFFMIKDIDAQSVGKNIFNYFRNDLFVKFRNIWEKYRKALENALSTALQDSFGTDAMNVYIKKEKDKLCRGYFHDDNLVQLILSDVDLEELPRLWKSYISFSLAANVIKIEARLSKMNIHADYTLLRNNSDIIYDVENQNASRTSPFLFEQVESLGRVTITIEHCLLNGFLMATLSGESVNIGLDFLKLSDCLYGVEIFKPGVGGPPVIAKYYPVGEGLTLNKLSMQPITAEFVPKLQAAMFALVNTTDIFGDLLPRLRKKQKEIFRVIGDFIAKVVRNLNKRTIKKNSGTVELATKMFNWDDNIERVPGKSSTLTLTDMVLTGLDTLYSAHIGGPYKISDLQIGEALRFSTIQVRGKVIFESTYGPGNEHEFAVEMKDVEVTVMIDVKIDEGEKGTRGKDEATPALKLKTVDVTGIRSQIFSVPGMVFAPLEPLITGFLQREVPKRIKEHILSVFDQSIEDTKIGTSKHGEKDRLLYEYSDVNTVENRNTDEGNETQFILYHPDDFKYLKQSKRAQVKSSGDSKRG